MSFLPLGQFKICDAGWELVVSPNGASPFAHTETVSEEVLLCSHPSTYGVQIPFKAYGEGKCRIVYKEFPELLQSLRVWQNTEYDFALKVPFKKAEFVGLASRNDNPIYPFKNRELSGFFSFNSSYACSEQGDFYVLTGRFNFKEFSGQAHLDLEIPSGVIPIPIEVMTSKLSYEKDYIRLVNDLSDIYTEIILKLDSPVSVKLERDYGKEVSPHAYMLHLRRLFEENRLSSSIALILNQPNSRVHTIIEKEEAAFVSSPCLQSLASDPFEHDWYPGGMLKSNFFGYTPKTLPSRTTRSNFNTIENQFIKHFIDRLYFKIAELIELIPLNYSASHFNLSRWHDQVSQWKSHPLWNDVSMLKKAPNSMVLMGRNGYREAFLDYLSFDLAIRLEGQLGEIAGDGQLKPVWELYQIWCYFMLYDCLKSVSNVNGSPGIETIFNKKFFDLRLKDGIGSKISFKFLNDDGLDVELNLYHNRTFSRTKLSNSWSEVYSGFYHPDFSVEIITNQKKHWIHFDAKYKLDMKEWEKEVFTDGEDRETIAIKNNGHPNLDKVHSYRDAILGTRGSYILFPGHHESESVYVRHANSTYRETFPGPSIGAFPLRPSDNAKLNKAQMENIKRIVLSFLQSSYDHNMYTEEEGFQ